MRVPKHLIACAAVIVLLAAGCSSDDDSKPNPADTTPAQAAPTSVVPLTALPSFAGDAGGVEAKMRQIITMAAQHAVGAPAEDQTPEVAAAESGCGQKLAAISCPGTDPQDKIVIYINSTVAWQTFSQPVGSGGGDAPLQSVILNAVAQDLAFRDLQRDNPEVLTADAADGELLDIMTKTVMCKSGEIYGGLRTMMSPELASLWSAKQSGKLGEYFTKGSKGEC